MNHDRWVKIEEIFHIARDLSAEKRVAYLESVCQGDKELKSEVESLIDCSENNNILSEGQKHLGLSIFYKNKQLSLIGKKFGRYTITKFLGQGGMGAVYQAIDHNLNRMVALKLLPEFMVENDENINRFQREALAASSISHPNIAHIYESGNENDQYFIVMEFVEGITLRELMNNEKIDALIVLDIVLQTANALAAAHRAGIIHRDIKPENIMIRPDGYVKVLDFGIAKLLEPDASQQIVESDENHPPSIIQNLQSTRTDLILGTVCYISLEQLERRDVDERTDIWSLGIVLYEVLSGNRPYQGKTVDELRREILRHDPPPLFFSNLKPNDEAFLGKIISRTLARDRGKRYESAYELAADLKQLKQNLEFTRQFSTGEIIGKTAPHHGLNTSQSIQNSSLIEQSRQFWTQQSRSRKTLILTFTISILTFLIGMSVQLTGFFRAATSSPKFESFLPDSRNRLRISTLFGVRKKLQGSIPFVSFSPDGNSISFAMSSEGTDDIYVKQLNQDQYTRLTDGKWIYQTPIWSPDGKLIAFVSNRDNTNAVWTISPQGSTPVLKLNLEMNFISCRLLKWSSDAKKLFFQSGKTLKTIELDSGRVEEIKFPIENVGTVFSVSADESLAAFVSVSGENLKLWVYNLKTGELIEIADEANLNLSPVILPDNKRIVYSSNRNGNSQLYIENFVDKKNSQITFGDSNAYSPVVSPDGNRIVYISENNTAHIFSMDVDSKKESRLTEATKMQLLPDLSNDAANLVFQVAEEYSNFTGSSLKLKNLQTGAERLLEGQNGFGAKWSPAVENEFAYIRHQGREFNIWKTELSGAQTKRLTTGGILIEGYETAPFNMSNIPFAWSPDGQKIAFVSKRSGSENVWVTGADGENPQMLTGNNDPKIGYSSAIWSPDGDEIAFIRRTQTEPGKFEYDVSIVSNNQVRGLFRDTRKMRLLGWNANGTRLLAAVDGSNTTEIYEIADAAASKLVTKLKSPIFPSVLLSPDGRSVVFSSVRNGICNIYFHLINGNEKQMTDNREDSILFSGICWSPAGNRIFYSKQSGGIQISMISDDPEGFDETKN